MCNLKSNKTLKEILFYKKAISNINQNNKEFVLFPSNIYLGFFYDANYKIGTQDISKYENGNYTGEVLAYQIASLNVTYALINHCETDYCVDDCILKIRNATKNKIKVVLCIGRQSCELHDNIENVKEEIKTILDQLTKEEIQNIILAYEPCFAINKKDIIAIEDIEKITNKIKVFVNCEYDVNIEMIYGGSINVHNFQKLLELDILDGYLIGNCANDPENIIKIAEFF